MVASSNNALYCSVTRRCPDPEPDLTATCVYKPVLGERPLDDFPDGTLAYREVAAHVVSEAIGWRIVPPTVLRDGPFGEGMVQLWIEPDPAVDPLDLLRASDPALRRMALFDAIGWNLNVDVLQNPGYRKSTAAIYASYVGVPEPATWITLILGFGLAGAAMRRRRALAA